MTMSRFLVVSEGAEPATAEPVIATGDPRLVTAALVAMFGAMNERPRPRSDRRVRPPKSEEHVVDTGVRAR